MKDSGAETPRTRVSEPAPRKHNMCRDRTTVGRPRLDYLLSNQKSYTILLKTFTDTLKKTKASCNTSEDTTSA